MMSSLFSRESLLDSAIFGQTLDYLFSEEPKKLPNMSVLGGFGVDWAGFPLSLLFFSLSLSLSPPLPLSPSLSLSLKVDCVYVLRSFLMVLVKEDVHKEIYAENPGTIS